MQLGESVPSNAICPSHFSTIFSYYLTSHAFFTYACLIFFALIIFSFVFAFNVCFFYFLLVRTDFKTFSLLNVCELRAHIFLSTRNQFFSTILHYSLFSKIVFFLCVCLFLSCLSFSCSIFKL